MIPILSKFLWVFCPIIKLKVISQVNSNITKKIRPRIHVIVTVNFFCYCDFTIRIYIRLLWCIFENYRVKSTPPQSTSIFTNGNFSCFILPISKEIFCSRKKSNWFGAKNIHPYGMNFRGHASVIFYHSLCLFNRQAT